MFAILLQMVNSFVRYLRVDSINWNNEDTYVLTVAGLGIKIAKIDVYLQQWKKTITCAMLSRQRQFLHLYHDNGMNWIVLWKNDIAEFSWMYAGWKVLKRNENSN